jgi:RNA 2',3'-cyclic 3'-phosphodiesterase
LFFALWPEPALQSALAVATQDVVLASSGRPTPPENFHITLAFVGSVPESSVAKVEAVGHEVAAETGWAPVKLILDAVEYWKKAKVVCATARASQHGGGQAGFADALATALKSRLTAAGFAPDLKPFRAHVTLARKLPHGTQDRALQSVLWTFTQFALVDSRTEAHGSMYTVVQTFRLGFKRPYPRV